MANVRSALALLGVILGVILAFVGRTDGQDLAEREWWEDTIVYQVWPRSFQDSDGDGTGDLQGIINHLDHFTELGVETIWLNSIYPSPLADSGYDVTDYESVDSTYGSLDDFDTLVTEAHNLGLKIILDFIPNHSSVDHPWFTSSVNRVDPYTDYYVWHNGTVNSTGDNVAPNNWESVMSEDGEGSAWTWDETRQQWYLHQFSADEADFDLRNEAVIQEFLDILDFWLDRGVDGFYINGVPYFLEDEDFTDNPTDSLTSTFGLDDNVALLYKFREHVDSWVSSSNNETKFLVAEGFEDDDHLIAYYGNETSEGIAPVNVRFITDITSTSNASHIKTTIDDWISALPANQSANWKISNQDYSRIASRFGLNRADGINMFVLALPGRVFTYYGEEIAMMDNEDITYTETVDELACTAGEDDYAEVSRDPYRTPMQWDTTDNAGFTTGSSYLPVNTNYATRNVETQLASDQTNIQTYKAVAALRSKPTFIYGSYEIQALNNDKVLVLRRSLDDYPTYVLVINLGLSRQTVDLTEIFTDLPSDLNISVLSNNAVLSGTTVASDAFTLTANAAVLLTDAAADDVPNNDNTVTGELDWWQNAVIYQIYVKSFQDSDGNGVGDLEGIISRLDFLHDTGINAFTLTPIYPSPQVDGGYDITDFVEIDPLFGSLEVFQELLDTAHEKDLKVILEFVPNHSSDQHIWFQNSVARVEPYTDYYVWKDAVTSNGEVQPPNNWLSVFGGSAWTWNEERQQYYLHQFHTTQPDLNFRNPAVVTEITEVLKFWLDKGVDGFRVSSVAHLFEDENFPDEPLNENPGLNVLDTDHDYLQHIYTTDLDETINLVYEWRSVVDEYATQSDGQTRILITDSKANLHTAVRYFGNEAQPGAHLPLNYAIITNVTRQSLAPSCIDALSAWLTILPEHQTSNWILGSHDHSRISSRFSMNRADGINMLHLLPGAAFTYMGEELALFDTNIPFANTQDPHAINAGPDRFQLFTRDPARTPYQWDNTVSAGFSTNSMPWLPVNANYLFRNLALQRDSTLSNYHTYKDIIKLKQTDTIKYGSTQFLTQNSDLVLAFVRELPGHESYVVVINLGLGQLIVDLSTSTTLPNEGAYVYLASSNSIIQTGSPVDITDIQLSANAALVVAVPEAQETDTVTDSTTISTETSTTPSEPNPIPTGPIFANDEIIGELDWWQNAAIYQIYPKSYQDSNGDGVGDLQGIISRLDHLNDTGVTAIWINSVFDSPQVDGGFDVSDFNSIDSLFGTIEDFTALVQASHEKGIKVIIDFVPNHSSDQHLWFQNSVARVEPYTDYYVWKDAVTLNGEVQPPNNWLSVFGGSAWTWNEDRQQYYLHQFDTTQPDLNFRNPAVVTEITEVLKFWLDQGVDGFRISSVAHLFEDEDFQDEPLNENPGSNVLETDHDYLQHIYTTDLNETIDIVYQWRTVVDEYTEQAGGDTRILITDSAANQDIVSRYFGNETHPGAHLPLNFQIIQNLNQASLAENYIQTLLEWFATLPENGTSNWIIGNHDQRRPASRFGLNRVDGLQMLSKLLPGTTFTYMGEELALLNTQISFSDTQDPHAINAGEDRFQLFTRDPARTPYHWDSSTSGGFSTNSSTWLPINPNYLTRNLAAQIAAEQSNFNTYKALLELRQTKIIQHGATHFLSLNDNNILAFTRTLEDGNVIAVVINLGLRQVVIDLSPFTTLPLENTYVVLASSNSIIQTGEPISITSVQLSANAALVISVRETQDAETSTDATTVSTETSTTPSEPIPLPTGPIFANDEIIGELDWWQNAAIYQIYPKSYQDSNGDGVGDLPGIISRLDHLKETGVTAIWINSVFDSPQVDGGFDVSDFNGIDSLFGTMEDFTALVQASHEKGIKVILDFVPNHSSDQHVWFQNSVARVEPYTDYYVWKDAVTLNGEVQPPNNWLSVFGGSAWTWNEERQQYYLHQFHTTQPDLNFRNPAIVTEITDVLKFWLDQGVDGFRVSSVAHLFEDEDFQDEPLNVNLGSNVLQTDYDHLEHIYTTDLDETIDIVYQWRTVVDEFTEQANGDTRILITDSAGNQDVVSRYFGNETHPGAHLPLNFQIIQNLNQASLAENYIRTLLEWFGTLPENGTSNWIIGNHDQRRPASRFGLNRVDGLQMLSKLLPGTTFTYMGEELALLDTQISFSDTQDPHAINAGEDRFQLFTRDPARTPYHWDSSTSGGFSTSSSTWLPMNPNYLTRNLAAQIAAEQSNFNTYKALIELRQTKTIQRGATHFLSLNDNNVLAFTRTLEDENVIAVVINLGLRQVVIDLSPFTTLPLENTYVVLASSNSIIQTGEPISITSVQLSANAALVISVRETQDAETSTNATPSEPIPLPTGPIFAHDEIIGELDWWQNAAIYQIYPKSFQDSDGDGVGDLPGIISRMDHLKETGVTAIWINSVFDSPQIDGGFDVSDFNGIDSLFGTIEDFTALVQASHAKGIKVILDFVPNHSSDQHLWFQNSVARVEPYTDYYVWKDAVTLNGELQPPNNWLSVFGGSAWTWNEDRQQYYLHQFDTTQPDLNFRNPTVVTEITEVLKFWLDQGVDGFRISSVAHLFEDEDFQDEPLNENPGSNVLETDHDYLQHIYTTDLDETIDIVYQWRTVVDEYTEQAGGDTRILITDSAANQDIVSRYFGNETHPGAHLPLNFQIIQNLNQASLAENYIRTLLEWFATLPDNGTSNWIIGNHDQRRPASRFGLNRVDGLQMLSKLLPGTTFTYMGEELALLDTQISFSDTQDPHAINAGEDRFQLFTRDPARTPYHWDSSTSGGFSTSSSTWLPMNPNYLTRNLAAQIAAEQSNFNTYKALLELRQTKTIQRGATHFLSTENNNVLAFTRTLEDENVIAVVINLGLRQVVIDLSPFTTLPLENTYVVLASSNSIIQTGEPISITSVQLSANAALVISVRETQDAETTTDATTVSTEPSTTPSEPIPLPTGPILGNSEIIGELEWWQNAAIYQIYPKSFQDSNGDGVGDLPGIISRLDHLKETGVTAIWINSVFDSPQVDGGFDVSDFNSIDSLFGTIEDFTALVQESHEKGIKVILDFIPNHSSDQHLWFQNSVARVEPYTDYYVWKDAVTSNGDVQPPNNWLSVFGGSAWTWNEERQQYYLHQFHTTQPDLNFRNPAVVTEITEVLKFWLDKGVDGFRVSSVAHLFEDENFPDEPLNEQPGPNVLETDYDYLEHIYTTDLDETIDIVYQWRTVVDEFTEQAGGDTRILITDSTADQDVVSRYFGNATHSGAHLPLNLQIIQNLNRASLAEDYIQTLIKWFVTLPEDGTSNWIIGNHDQRRPASRFGLNRVDGLQMLSKLLPGTTFTYMGEELALLDTQISFSNTQDPHAINAGADRFQLFTRDPARTPYHWDSSTSGGFSTSSSTWLPINSNYLIRNLAAQIAAEQSNFNTYKALLELRQTKTIQRGATHFLSLNDNNVLAFTRTLEDEDIYAVAINLGLETVKVDLSGFSGFSSDSIRVCLSSSNAAISTGTIVDITSVSLSANAAVVLCDAELPLTTTTSSLPETSTLSPSTEPWTSSTTASIPTTTLESQTESEQPDEADEVTTADPGSKAVTAYVSSMLIVITLANIFL